jgi:steroid delta-isomerase-like uncharacterized protein
MPSSPASKRPREGERRTSISTEENKALSRRVAEGIFNAGNLDLADALYAPDYVLHDPSLPEDLHGPEGLKRYVAMASEAFPDARVTIAEQVAEGEKVVDRWTARGTHTGRYLGIPPTGRHFEITGITISRFSGGKIAEDWYQGDVLGMLQQLGVIPSDEGEALSEPSEEASPT